MGFCLNLEHESSGIFQELLNPDKKRDRLLPIHNPMVIRQRYVHHRPNLNLLVDDNRPLLNRVQAQGDMRPMAGNSEAMDDLKGILAQRSPFYAKAELHLDSSIKPLDETFLSLRAMVRKALQLDVKG